ncbi:hypothetical protein ACFFLM_24735 [Deinococcus oregonensis]|uniref:Uncharacterized protein n=1 Tax=Deinococcus oregonensis TaxID=1805970 RepID=A0ABV6B5X1_9DEIO
MLMSFDQLPDQSTFEGQLGGPLQFHGLISPALSPPPSPIHSSWAYRRRSEGFDQRVEASNSVDLVCYGPDALVLEALLRLHAVQAFSDREVTATAEQLLLVMQEIDPHINLSSPELLASLSRLMGTVYHVTQPKPYFWSFGFRLITTLDVLSQSDTRDGPETLREITVELSEVTLVLHASGMLRSSLWKAQHQG